MAIFAIARTAPEGPRGVEAHAFPRMRSRFRLDPALVRSLRAWKPDIVHLHSVYVPENAALARKLRAWGIPYAVTPHGALSPAVEGRGRLRKSFYKRLFEKSLYNHAALMHAIADAEYIRAYGVHSPVVSAVNGIDVKSIPATADPTIASRRFPALSDRRTLIFLGRIDPYHKGLDLFIRGFAEAKAEHPALAAVLVGPDWRGGRAETEQLIESLGLADDVVFWGPAYEDEKYSVLASGSVFVHTSRWEAGVPFAVLEALASGLPCLVTNAADPDAVIARHHAGMVVEPDVREIAHAISAIGQLTDSELRAMGDAAFRLARDDFSWEKTAQKLISAYAEYCPDMALPVSA